MSSEKGVKQDTISARFLRFLGQRLNDNTKYKVGRLLTIVDGVIIDPTQRKAIKNMVERVVYGEDGKIYDYLVFYVRHLAKALGEVNTFDKCDAVDDKDYNPLTD